MILYFITGLVLHFLLMIAVHQEEKRKLDKVFGCFIALMASSVWPFTLALALMFYGSQWVSDWIDLARVEDTE